MKAGLYGHTALAALLALGLLLPSCSSGSGGGGGRRAASSIRIRARHRPRPRDSNRNPTHRPADRAQSRRPRVDALDGPLRPLRQPGRRRRTEPHLPRGFRGTWPRDAERLQLRAYLPLRRRHPLGRPALRPQRPRRAGVLLDTVVKAWVNVNIQVSPGGGCAGTITATATLGSGSGFTGSGAEGGGRSRGVQGVQRGGRPGRPDERAGHGADPVDHRRPGPSTTRPSCGSRRTSSPLAKRAAPTTASVPPAGADRPPGRNPVGTLYSPGASPLPVGWTHDPGLRQLRRGKR